jgi:prepilin-type N-terminal cleavage/methylation domain-containing protein
MLKNIMIGKMQPGHRNGFSLIEVLIATALLGIFVVVLISSLSTASKALILNDTRQEAKNLAETQMEIIKKAPYSTAYILPPPADSSYASNVTVDTSLYPSDPKDINVQKITIEVSRYGKSVYTLEDYRAN